MESARVRAGVALYPVPLGPTELNTLVMLRWLPDAAVGDRVRVGEAVAVAFQDMLGQGETHSSTAATPPMPLRTDARLRRCCVP